MTEEANTPATADTDMSAVFARIVRLGSALEEREPKFVDVRSLGAEIKALGLMGQRMVEKAQDAD